MLYVLLARARKHTGIPHGNFTRLVNVHIMGYVNRVLGSWLPGNPLSKPDDNGREEERQDSIMVSQYASGAELSVTQTKALYSQTPGYYPNDWARYGTRAGKPIIGYNEVTLHDIADLITDLWGFYDGGVYQEPGTSFVTLKRREGNQRRGGKYGSDYSLRKLHMMGRRLKQKS